MFFKRKSHSIEVLREGRTSNLEYYSDNTSNETVDQQTETLIFKPYLGLFYLSIYAICNQLASVIIKMLPYIDPSQLSLIRNVGGFVGILPITIYYTTQFFGEKKDRLTLLIRGFMATTGLYFMIMAYSYLPLAEAAIILSITPILTAIVARIILKEPYGILQSISLIISCCGVLLAIRVPKLLQNRKSVAFDYTYVAGLTAAIGCVLFLSLSSVYIRKLKNAHFSNIMIYVFFTGIIENLAINGIFIPFVPTYCGWDQIFCIFLGALYFTADSFLVLSFQVLPAGQASVERSCLDILIIIVFQIIFFGAYPDVYVVCGACFVIVSLIILGFVNGILLMPETSKLRRKVKWLL